MRTIVVKKFQKWQKRTSDNYCGVRANYSWVSNRQTMLKKIFLTSAGTLSWQDMQKIIELFQYTFESLYKSNSWSIEWQGQKNLCRNRIVAQVTENSWTITVTLQLLLCSKKSEILYFFKDRWEIGVWWNSTCPPLKSSKWDEKIIVTSLVWILARTICNTRNTRIKVVA